MAERQMTERTYGRKPYDEKDILPKTFGRIDIWPKDIQPKRQKFKRQMADKHKVERTLGRNNV